MTAASTSASGTRFGRVSAAADTARPEPRGAFASGDGNAASTQASSHHAVTGTSLIGWNVWNMKIGLKATRIAAIIPVYRAVDARAEKVGEPHRESRRAAARRSRPPLAPAGL